MALRNPDWIRRRLVAIAGVEALSDGVARALLPMVAVAWLGAGGIALGVLNSASLVAFLLLSAPLGAVIDRRGLGGSRLMVRGSACRSIVAAGLVALFATGRLHGQVGLVVVVAAACLIGLCDVVFTAGLAVAVPRLVGVDEVAVTVGRLQASGHALAALAPLLLGAVALAMSAPLAWLVPAVGYLVSAAVALSLPAAAVAPQAGAGLRLGDGWRALATHRLLVRVTFANAAHNCATIAANLVVPIVALAELGVHPGWYAMAGGAGAVAGVVGALVAPKLSGRIGFQAARLVALGIGLIGWFALAVAWVGGGPSAAIGGVVAQLACGGFAGALAVVVGSDLVPRLVRPERLASALGAQRTVALGVMPVAGLVVGVLVDTVGIGIGFGAWGLLLAASALPLFGLGKVQQVAPEVDDA